jgi:hypothetical protein
VEAALEHAHTKWEVFAVELAVWDCGGIYQLEGCLKHAADVKE